MANQDLNPQFFPDDAKTLIPNKDFFVLAKEKLPQIYQLAIDFMGLIFSIATIKQGIYDVIQSLANVYNIYSSTSDNPAVAVPQGIYLKMLATNFGANFSEGDSDSVIFTSIINRITSVVSRGSAETFYNYFSQNNLGGQFTNLNVEETGNATIFFNVPIPDDPLLSPNPFQVFKEAMFRLKAAGVKVVINSTANIPYFQLADLNGNVGPGNAGFAGLDAFGQSFGGGFYTSL